MFHFLFNLIYKMLKPCLPLDSCVVLLCYLSSQLSGEGVDQFLYSKMHEDGGVVKKL